MPSGFWGAWLAFLVPFGVGSKEPAGMGNGTKGMICFEQERMNELQIYQNTGPKGEQGFKTILTGPDHPPPTRLSVFIDRDTDRGTAILAAFVEQFIWPVILLALILLTIAISGRGTGR